MRIVSVTHAQYVIYVLVRPRVLLIDFLQFSMVNDRPEMSNYRQKKAGELRGKGT